MNKIAIIEDDFTIRNELSNILKTNAYNVKIVENFLNYKEEIEDFEPTLILLDINLPNIDGFKICQQIRTFSKVPIIFVTSRDTEMDELNSIMFGGDAFITKPYNIPILLAKISYLINRIYCINENNNKLNYKNTILNIENDTLQYNDKIIELTKNETKILYYLYKNNNKICKRIDIIEYLWDNKMYIDDNTLSVNINRIRNKLLEIGLNNFIITKHRQGYII